MPDFPADDLLAVAYILRTHGVRGEVSCVVPVPAVLDPAQILCAQPLTLRAPGGSTRTVNVESARPHQDRWLLKLAGVDSMTDAEGLKGHDLLLARTALPALPEGWYWEADLAGCRVVDARLGEIGTAERLRDEGVQPQLLIRRPQGGHSVQIPWVKAYIKQVDLTGRTIQTDLPTGMPGIEDDAGEAGGPE